MIGTGRLSDGEVVSLGPENTAAVATTWYCQFSFSAPLIETADFYTVEVAGREGPVYSHAEMVEDDWVVDLEVGP